MKVDIIIPAYGCRKTIDRAIASVAMQKLKDGNEIAVTIVNDADPVSEYHSAATYWSAVVNTREFVRESNGGAGQARQSGFDNTDGEFVMYLDADDVLASPFAVQMLLDAIGDRDMAMGSFIEETPAGTMLTHGENYVWMHGKLIRRAAVEKMGLCFNKLRCNEDAGWNSVFRGLGGDAVYIPQTVYIWMNEADSTVRRDAERYAYEYGWWYFIENMDWAATELVKRGACYSAAELVLSVYAKLYVQLMLSMEKFPESIENSMRNVSIFALGQVTPMISAGLIRTGDIKREIKKALAENTQPFLPFISIEDFLLLTGVLTYKEPPRALLEPDAQPISPAPLCLGDPEEPGENPQDGPQTADEGAENAENVPEAA